MTSPLSTVPADGCAWVTGGSTGIGAAIALKLAEAGWTVAVSARGAEALQAMAAGFSGNGKIVAFPLDVTDIDAVRATEAAIEAQCGPVALAILSAGTFKAEEAKNFTAARVKLHFDLNVMGVAHVLEMLLPKMIARRKGQVAIISSVAGYRGLPTSPSYSGSKAALIAMAESLKLDCDRYNVKIQVVNPGFIKTPLTDKNEFPMPFLMPVEKAAEALARGLRGNGFEIAFPTPFVLIMKFIRHLPNALYFAAMRGRLPKP